MAMWRVCSLGLTTAVKAVLLFLYHSLSLSLCLSYGMVAFVLFFSQLEAEVAESASRRVSNGTAAAAASSLPQSGYTAGGAEGGAARSLGEDGEEAVAVAEETPAAEANGAEDLSEKVATMQAEVGVLVVALGGK